MPDYAGRPGPWRTVPYQREILDCITDPECERVTWRKSTQVGGSSVLYATVGWYIHLHPRPMMMVFPTDVVARSQSKRRITPFLEQVPALKAKVRQATARRAGNTILMKEIIGGGIFKITGANSAASLRADDVGVIFFDEVDGYPSDVDKEGHPIEIAEHRLESYPDARVFLCSTPAKPTGFSRIDKEYEAGSQALFHVPCPLCGYMQPLWWRDPANKEVYRLKFERDGEGNVVRESVRYLCAGCDRTFEEKEKADMLAAGEWRHRFPERRHHRSFHLNGLYSPWKRVWHRLAQEWLKAQRNPEELRTFINLSLGETWKEAGTIEHHMLAPRIEQYPLRPGASREELQQRAAPVTAEHCLVPRGVAVLVAAVDVQGNRIEAQILGFGAGEECWLIAYETFWGDPGIGPGTPAASDDLDPWGELDAWLLKQWPHESGAMMTPAICLIDSSSGSHRDAVYSFALPRQNARRIFASKGAEKLAKGVLAGESTTKKHKIRLWIIDSTAGKDRVLARLGVTKPGPAYLHLPEWTSEEYLKQLTSETRVGTLVKKTRHVRYEYVKTYERNEALDLNVYCHAGLFILQNYIDPGTYRDLPALAARIQQNKPVQPPPRGRRLRHPGLTP